MKPCPFCAEEIQDAAIVCKHCGRDLTSDVKLAGTVTPQAVKKKRFGRNTLIVLGILFVLWLIGRSSEQAAPLTQTHRDAVDSQLKSKALTTPTSINVDNDTGFVVAEYELTNAYAAQLAIPFRAFAEVRLLAIREALLPYGYKNYRVNINGESPGTGLVRRFGSARFIEGGAVEWLTP